MNIMEVLIRQEIQSDRATINDIVQNAFAELEISDQTEHLLVQRLRKSKEFIPELSLVAIVNEKLVGHIILTPIKIKNEKVTTPSLALAPVSVLPKMQRKGIGSALIKSAHQIAIDLGHTSIILIGHEDYYPRFGYLQANEFGINFPFEVPHQNGFVIELVIDSLCDVKGTVTYPPSFLE